MTSKARPKAKDRKPKTSDVELEPHAWDRFEATVNTVVQAKEPMTPPRPG